MFGLHVPLQKSLASCDFDGVQAILFNSGLREPSHWQTRVDKDGRIFHLELESSSCDAADPSSLDKECCCVCSDCATDDTGYGTDTDLYASYRKGEEDRKHLESKDFLNDFSDIDELINRSKLGRDYDDRILEFESEADFQQAEENIDSLFTSSVLGKSVTPITDTEIDDIVIDIDHLLEEGRKSNNTLGKNNKSKAMKAELVKSEISYKDLPTGGKRSSLKCECSEKNVKSARFDVSVDVKLRPQKLVESVNTVQLCEKLLGIVPGHYGSSQGSQHHRRRDRRVKVRGLVPTGVASKYTDIHVGDCLLSVNNQDVTWDNLDTILRVLVHQRQASLVLRRNAKRESSSVLVKKRNQSETNRLVQLLAGSNTEAKSVDDVAMGDWEPFYGAMYLSLEGVSSDNMQAKEDIVYQFPRVDNKLIDSRGIFITLAGTLKDATRSTVQSTTLTVEDGPIHVVYHCDGQNLFVVSAHENRFSRSSLTSLVKDLVRLLQVTHGSIQQAFTSPANHGQLDCFFALLHQAQTLNGKQREPVCNEQCNLSQSAKILPLPNEIKVCVDRVLTDFEAADFGDMSDSYYGCRRSYSVLGSCLFYKNYLMSNHLPRDDVVDFSTYLRYHSILSLSSEHALGQLVVWREAFPTRHCHAVAEEQSFGYTEPLIARWYWLIVGYKHLVMCIMLETGGCTAVTEGVSAPDPFLIDQAKAVLMQLDGQSVSSYCQNSISNPSCPIVTKPDIFCQRQQNRHDLLSRSLKKLPHKISSQHGMLGGGGLHENPSSLRQILHSRKDSYGSDNSSESSGESLFKFSRKGRLFPETTDLLQNITESNEDLSPINSNRKLTVGVENCLFHFQYYDNLEGMFVSSGMEAGESSINKEIYNNFQKCCRQIKRGFDNARKIKEQQKQGKDHVLGFNEDFTLVREEAVMFTCPAPSADKKNAAPLCYWVAGRCISRSMRREVYVCFHESTPQTVIELAFKLAFGYFPL